MKEIDVEKIREKMKNVPFGNSVFQIQHFISNDHTPERNYRNALLQLHGKLNALQECAFRRRRKEIDIEEMEEKLADLSKSPEMRKYEIRRVKIDLEEARLQLDNEIKFIEDAMVEVKAYEKILDELPDFTREEFEQSEKGYWEQRLLNDARRQIESNGRVDAGFLDSLEKIGLRVKLLPEGGFHVFGQLEDQSRSKLNLIDLPEVKQ